MSGVRVPSATLASGRDNPPDATLRGTIAGHSWGCGAWREKGGSLSTSLLPHSLLDAGQTAPRRVLGEAPAPRSGACAASRPLEGWPGRRGGGACEPPHGWRLKYC